MAYHTTGTKFEATRDLDIAAIAKLVRADIKAAVKSGELPAGLVASVRISRYSMGQSLGVSFGAPGVNPVNPDWAAASEAARFGWDGGPGFSRLTGEGMRIEAVVAGIVGAYNFNNSDSMSDYYHTRFSASANWDSSFLRACEADAAASVIDFAADFSPAVVAAALADYIVEAPAGDAPALGTIVPFRARVASGLEPVIAGPARAVPAPVNEDGARFAFWLGLDEA